MCAPEQAGKQNCIQRPTSAISCRAACVLTCAKWLGDRRRSTGRCHAGCRFPGAEACWHADAQRCVAWPVVLAESRAVCSKRAGWHARALFLKQTWGTHQAHTQGGADVHPGWLLFFTVVACFKNPAACLSTVI